MKTRIAFPLLRALGFLLIAVTSGSAQMPTAPLTPVDLYFSLDTSFVTYDLSQTTIQSKTISGSIQNLDPASNGFTVNLQTSRQWVVQTKIGGVVMQGGDPLNLSSNQVVPVEITLFPYAEGPDTESYCVTVMYGSKPAAQQCVTLAVTHAQSAVSPDAPALNITLVPNPAGSNISLRGLDKVQTGYRYEIYSESGAEVLHGMLSTDARINVHELASGAYRLLLFEGKQTMANKAFTILH